MRKGSHADVTKDNTAKAASDCLNVLIKVFIYVISKDEGTGSDKISNNSWNDVSGS